jgi:hypothetical protein
MRFTPDSLIDALLRYLAMAAPDASVYVEIAAPDLRFAVMALLAVVALVFWRRQLVRGGAVPALLALVVVATIPWLMTTGNGRYWITMLLCVGPVVAGLVYLLPLTRLFRLFLAGGVLAAQFFVVWINLPWDSWRMVSWERSPYFHIAAPKAIPGEGPVTYVTLATISYSAVAPQFPANSRWINIGATDQTERDVLLRERFLAQAGRLELLVPSILGEVTADRQPTAAVRRSIDVLMGHARLAIDTSRPCVLLESRGLAPVNAGKRVLSPQQLADIGFWLCPLRRTATAIVPDSPRVAARTEAAFNRVEQMCPRYFAGGSKLVPIEGGVLRTYTSDMKVYVLDDGQVIYKYWRAINPTVIGTVDDLLSGKAVLRCDQLKGRSGLPWEREI